MLRSWVNNYVKSIFSIRYCKYRDKGHYGRDSSERYPPSDSNIYTTSLSKKLRTLEGVKYQAYKSLTSRYYFSSIYNNQINRINLISIHIR